MSDYNGKKPVWLNNMSDKMKVSVSDIEHMAIPGVSVWYATVRIGNRKNRTVTVKTSQEFKRYLRAKISAYCKNRQK